MKQMVFATNSDGKLIEMRSLLGNDVEVLSMRDFDLTSPEETGTTFVENAIIKARYVAEKTGLPTLADDSGLCVPALQGAPGVYSSRYAGEDCDHQANIAKLLDAMQDLTGDARQAYFYCVLVYMHNANDGAPLIAEGRWDGSILLQPVEAGGFGYDPIFGVIEPHCAASQLSLETKNRLSHRGKALKMMQHLLDNVRQ